MDWQFADPPGTICPMRLLKVGGEFSAAPIITDDSQTRSAQTPQNGGSLAISDEDTFDREFKLQVAAKPTGMQPEAPRLRRISTEHEETGRETDTRSSNDGVLWKEFQTLCGRRGLKGARRAGPSHRDYFGKQMECSPPQVPVDPDRWGSCQVFVQASPADTIYDAYLLKVNIMKNTNHFHRLQVRL
jgi:hypothetical protein